MTRQVVTAASDTSISARAGLMLDHRIGALAVVEGDAHVVGIISDYDLLKHPASDSPRAWWLRLFNEDAVCLEDIATARSLTAGDIMVRPVAAVADTTPLGVLASLMRRHKLRHEPVLGDGKLVGIVSRGDLLDALAWQGSKRSSRNGRTGNGER